MDQDKIESMSDQEITISAQTLLLNIRRFQALGGILPEGPLLGGWEEALALLENSDRRFPITLISTSLEFASQQLQDPVLGLNAVDQDELPFIGMLDILRENTSTLEDFVQVCSRYSCIYSEIGTFKVQFTKTGSQVLFCPRDRSITSDHQVDGLTLLMARAIELYAGILPLRVDIDHACPKGCEAIYLKKLGGPVHFSQPQAALYYSADEMTRLRNDSDILLMAPVLERQRDQLYDPDVIEKTEFLIRRLLIRGEPNRDTIAQALALSLRTFQRLLSSQNTTYRDILDTTRQRMAQEYLQDSSFTVQEIALLLGYTETSQFYKAFRRWFDCSPSDFRNNDAPSQMTQHN